MNEWIYKIWNIGFSFLHIGYLKLFSHQALFNEMLPYRLFSCFCPILTEIACYQDNSLYEACTDTDRLVLAIDMCQIWKVSNMLIAYVKSTEAKPCVQGQNRTFSQVMPLMSHTRFATNFWASIGPAYEDEKNIIGKLTGFEVGMPKIFYKGPQTLLLRFVAGSTCKIYNKWHTWRPKVLCQLYSSHVIYKHDGGPNNKPGGPQFGLPWFGLILIS